MASHFSFSFGFGPLIQINIEDLDGVGRDGMGEPARHGSSDGAFRRQQALGLGSGVRAGGIEGRDAAAGDQPEEITVRFCIKKDIRGYPFFVSGAK